ncbi:MAG: GNAT family N-acetyltransferase [Actinomycetota bacterium]|nr:GNAT family N-acetyltransferase [Actinomycetota bacterium]
MSAQTIERLGERARLATWRGDGVVAHLAPAATRPLSAEFVADCLDWLRARGYQSVVTSALSAAECQGFLRTGFAVQEELDLLTHDLGRLPPRPHGLRRAWRRDRPAVIEVDALAFPPFWRLHEGGLEEALAATPSVRFRVAGRGRGGLAGYAIAGRGGDTGYLQRLAVHPAARGRGLGRTLVVDALVWLRRRGAARAMVNTQRTNEGALALYQACGFRLLPEGLSVLAREL